MKIACCQFSPKWSDVQGNINMVNQLLEIYKPNDMDLLILPEMAFTGYVFQNVQEIMPFLEDSETGPSVQWAKRQAIRLQCFVIVGYPQKKDQHYYNSLCCVNPEGKVITTYQKTFLYETDENWAIEGPGFVSLQIDPLGKIGFGICMDLNPYKFKSDFYDCEFANYHLNEETEIILCSMAWLKSKQEEEEKEEEEEKKNKNDLSTIRYWAMRLLPLYRDVLQDHDRHTIFVACNRTGKERGVEFAGSSCVLDISNENITILDHMHRNTGVMIVEII